MTRLRRCALALLLASLVAAAGMGCGRSPINLEWGQDAKIEGLDRRQAQGFWVKAGGDEIESARFDMLLPLSKVFYERTTNRRLNSKATFNDPALREFFRDPASFADYYAALVESLDRAYFESFKPTHVNLRRIERVAPKRVEIEVRFRGENRKPLRFWSTFVTRTDQWEFAAGRWWVIPGKV